MLQAERRWHNTNRQWFTDTTALRNDRTGGLRSYSSATFRVGRRKAEREPGFADLDACAARRVIQQGQLAHGAAPADMPCEAAPDEHLQLPALDDVHGVAGLPFLHQPLPGATGSLLHRVDQGVHLHGKRQQQWKWRKRDLNERQGNGADWVDVLSTTR